VAAALRTPTADEIRAAKANAAGDAAVVTNLQGALAAAQKKLDGLPASADDAARNVATTGVAAAQSQLNSAIVRAARSKTIADALQGTTPVSVTTAATSGANINPTNPADPLLGALLPRPNCAPLNADGKS
jgi:hypothetical protein